MSYEVIKNFQGGLDARRFFLSLPAGTLTQLINAHITQGGEIEKRKQFLQITLPSGTGYTFGGQETDNGIVVFGSASPATVGALPSPFIYQQLINPLNSGATMTAVVWSTCFGGNAWVIANYSDGNTFEFYNGVVIQDFFSGMVLTGQSTNAQIATALQALIAATGNYTVTDIDATSFYVFSIPSSLNSTPFSISETIDSIGGAVTITPISSGIPSIEAVTAIGQIQIIAGGSNTPATGTVLNNNANPANATVLVIGSTSYKFVNTFSGLANEILIQSTADKTSDALINAINNGAGSGVTYSALTLKNTQVTASALSTHTFTVTSIVGGSAGNSLAFTTTSSWTLSGATLSGGDASNTNQITQIAVGSTNLLTSPVPYNKSQSQTGSDLAVAINNNTATSGYTAQGNNGVVTISPVASGNLLNGTAITTTCAGNVCVDNCLFSSSALTTNSSNVSEIAVGSQTSGVLVAGVLYQITNFVTGDDFTNLGAGSNATGVIFTSTGTTPTNWTHGSTVSPVLMSATIKYQDSGHSTETVGAFVARIAANINSNTSKSGWLAYADGTKPNVYISKAVRVSSDSNPTIVLTYANMTIGVPSGTTYTITVALSTTSLTLKYQFYIGKTGSVQATGSGGLAPYSFKWVFVSNSIQATPLLYPTAPTSATTAFKTHSAGFFTETWKCVVTDSNNTSSDVDSVTIHSTWAAF